MPSTPPKKNREKKSKRLLVRVFMKLARENGEHPKNVNDLTVSLTEILNRGDPSDLNI